MSPTSSKKVTDSDSLFEQAVEDITRLAQDVDDWQASENPSAGLPSLATSHGRGRLALARLAETAPVADQKYLRQLELKFHEAEVDLNAHFAALSKSDARFFAENGYPYRALKEADRSLRSVREITRDGLYFDNEEWNFEELVQAASDFLVLFTELAWLARWSHPSLTAMDGFRRWQEEFGWLEDRFRGWFGYFHPVKAMLANIRKREYDAVFWWLMTSPTREMIAADAFTDDQIKDIGRLLREQGMTPEPCPEQMIIALALGDPLTEDDKNRLAAHMKICEACRKLHQDVSEANWETTLKTVPAYQLMAEASDHIVREDDAPGGLHPVNFDFPVPVQNSLNDDGWRRMAQMGQPHQESLCAQASTGPGTGVWAKILKIVNDAPRNLSIVELASLHLARDAAEGRLFITGELPSWLRLPEKITWFCDWLRPNGTMLAPAALNTKNGIFSARFELGSDASEEDGELRVLILAYPRKDFTTTGS